MSKLTAFVQLDLLTLKPYLKSVVALLGVGAILGFVQRDAYAIVAICIVYVLLIMAYPFTIGEKNTLDMLYATLAIRRRTVVFGRYALTLLVFTVVTLLGVLLAYGMARLLGFPFAWPDMAMLVAIFFIVFALAAALQLPLYFKLGYAKARLLTYLPLALIPVVLYLFSLVNDAETIKPLIEQIAAWADANRGLTYLLSLSSGLLILAVSATIARRFYEQREF